MVMSVVAIVGLGASTLHSRAQVRVLSQAVGALREVVGSLQAQRDIKEEGLNLKKLELAGRTVAWLLNQEWEKGGE